MVPRSLLLASQCRREGRDLSTIAVQSGVTKEDCEFCEENVDDRSTSGVKSHAVPFEEDHDKADTASNIWK